MSGDFPTPLGAPLRKLSNLLLELHAIESLAQFPNSVCRVLPQLVRSEIASYCDSRGGLHHIPWHEADETWTPKPRLGVMMCTRADPLFSDLRETFLDMVPHQPLYPIYYRTLDGTARRISDAQSLRSFKRTRLYTDIYKPMNVDREVTFYLPAPPDGHVTIALSRHRTDFSQEEIALLELIRPHLEMVYRRLVAKDNALRAPAANTLALAKTFPTMPSEAEAIEIFRRAGLTPQQSVVLRWLACGKTNPQIAAILGCSALTVKTHVAHILLKLKAPTRTAATVRAFELIGRK